MGFRSWLSIPGSKVARSVAEITQVLGRAVFPARSHRDALGMAHPVSSTFLRSPRRGPGVCIDCFNLDPRLRALFRVHSRRADICR